MGYYVYRPSALGASGGGSGAAPTLISKALTSDFTLSSTATEYTDITGLSQAVTLSAGQIIEILVQGTILSTTTSNFSILARITDGTTEFDSWYHSDAGSVTAYRVPLFLKYIGLVGDHITAGEYTFKIQGRNLQGTDAAFEGDGSQACTMDIKVYG